ncbi:MAG: c-type cytochrome [Chlamydiae bacterium]|nr:c-type cytochrome [Chlamydiota bacterium]MBI3276527.1 c-type cytochrome [Chlamydiota bacterium]
MKLNPIFLGGLFLVLCLFIGFSVFSRKEQPAYGKLTLPKLDLKTLNFRIEEGRALFQTKGCVNCHTFKGIGKPVAASLSMLRNSTTPDFSKAWIENPQKMRPGVRMEKINMTQEELLSLLYYLYESN